MGSIEGSKMNTIESLLPSQTRAVILKPIKAKVPPPPDLESMDGLKEEPLNVQD